MVWPILQALQPSIYIPYLSHSLKCGNIYSFHLFCRFHNIGEVTRKYHLHGNQVLCELEYLLILLSPSCLKEWLPHTRDSLNSDQGVNTAARAVLAGQCTQRKEVLKIPSVVFQWLSLSSKESLIGAHKARMLNHTFQTESKFS